MKMEGSIPGDGEAQLSATAPKRAGGWITFPFIITTMAGLSLASGGWMNNLIVFMIGEFNVKTIAAAQIFSIVNGCVTMFPILGAIFADSFLGSFSVIWISSLIHFLGIFVLFLSSTIHSLRPPPCDQNSPTSCLTSSKLQFSILYLGIALATIGVGGMGVTLSSMGANQFDSPKHRASFFNWAFFTSFVSSAISATAIVYVEDNVSWGLGFGLCATASAVGLAAFVIGSRFYRRVKPKGSPFIGLARVVVAAVRKRNVVVSVESEVYYHGKDGGRGKVVAATPTNSFKFLNRAALIIEGYTRPDGSITKPWNLCTLHQVEDLKTLIRLFPLWSTGIFLATPLGIQISMVTLQALAMDRHIGPHLHIPAGSMIVFVLISSSLAIILLNRFLYPIWQKLTGRFPTPLQRIGIGHVFCVLSMAVSAVMESKRLKSAHKVDPSSVSVLWLVPQLALVGVGEAFHFPGNNALFYGEFPTTLKSTATAMVAMFMGIAFYLSTGVVGVVRQATGWLPDDINHGRMDNVFWLLFGLGGVNFGYYLACAWFYQYQDVAKVADESGN